MFMGHGYISGGITDMEICFLYEITMFLYTEGS